MGFIIGGFAFNNFFTEIKTRLYDFFTEVKSCALLYKYRKKKYKYKNKQNNFNEETI